MLRVQLAERPEIAPATVALTRDPDGHWRASSSALSLAGRWTVTALVESPDDSQEVPMEFEARPGS
jgi:hypothetical protein